MSTTAELHGKVLDFTKLASEIVGESAKEAEERLEECKRVRPLVDKVADDLSGNLVEESERDEAAKLASTHEGALTLASRLIRHIEKVKQASAQKQAQATLGKGVPGGREKKASDSTESPFVGRRAGLGEKRASDEALFAGLGLNPDNPAGK
jgi:hypothetical protein